MANLAELQALKAQRDAISQTIRDWTSQRNILADYLASQYQQQIASTGNVQQELHAILVLLQQEGLNRTQIGDVLRSKGWSDAGLPY